ncbi:MviN family membrane protein PslK [Pseudomonas amygdali pv. dendropanacis]|uniref:MviN family membrane protein PslK n=2 Tax=Pseudomonas amygdali TaxID=47877 RepID=A0A0P9SYP5_PSEAV|nr:MviN family membrane protein PslK [Pseudomonas amygdali pv. dendropanacis]KPX66536.1 MviN family membrane protein PslK [Pseudomonas amygdali pv. lachrymans]
MGGALVTGVLLMRRQALLGVLPWRSHWLLASLLMIFAALLLHPLHDTWLQLGLSCVYGALLLLGLALWLKPWRNVPA